MVSDFDLLSLDHISGERETSGMFPDIATDWQSFQEVQKLILKNHGKLYATYITSHPQSHSHCLQCRRQMAAAL